MSKWLKRFNRLVPRGKAIAKAEEESRKDCLRATQEQATAVNMAIKSAVTVAEVGQVNYNNGFSVALGNAFARKGSQ